MRSPPSISQASAAVRFIADKSRLRPLEIALWVVLIAVFFVADSYLSLASQVLIAILFALSLDLILGYAGIVTLGHGLFFGIGAYTAGILALRGLTEPLSGLFLSSLAAALVGLVTGLVILRTRGLTLVMLTLSSLLIGYELANRAGWLTGGADGLTGFTMNALFGQFRFDVYGRTAYLYCLGILALGWWLVRTLVHSPFGQSLKGIRENPLRMRALGTPVQRHLVIAYTLSAGLAGTAGALLAQTTQSVALNMMDVDRSGMVLVMLALGGVGRLYGAFVGVPVFMLAQDALSKQDPTYWLFWMGVALICIVLFARGGLLGLWDRVVHRFAPRSSTQPPLPPC